MSLLKNTSWSILNTLSQSATGLASLIIIARSLDPENAGSILYVLWLADTSIIIFGFGLQNSIIKFLASSKVSDPNATNLIQAWIFRKYIFSIALGCILFIIIYACNKFWSDIDITLLVVVILFRSIYVYYSSYLSGIQNYSKLAKVTLTSNLFQIISLLVLPIYLGNMGVFISYCTGCILPIYFVLKLNLEYQKYPEPCAATKKEVIKYTLDMWFALIIGAIIWSRFEIYFLKEYISIDVVAYYSVALTFALIINQIPSLITGPLLPYFSTQFELKNFDHITCIYNIYTLMLSLIIFPLVFITASLLPVMIPYIYGGKYFESIIPAQLLVISSSMSFAAAGTPLMMALGKSRFMSIGGIYGAILLIVSCIIFIPNYGVTGAAFSRSLSQICMIILGTYYIHKKLNTHFPFISIIKILFYSLLASSLTFLITIFYNSPYISLISAFISIAFYTFIIRNSNLFDEINPYYLNLLIDRCPPKLSFIIHYLLKTRIRVV